MMKTNSPFELIPEESTPGGGPDGGSSTAPVGHVVSTATTQPLQLSLEQSRFLAAAAAANAAVSDQHQRPLFPDFALQQHMYQVKQQQLLQRQILEHQIKKNREILQVEHERQLSQLLQQAQILKAKEDQDASMSKVNKMNPDTDRQERLRLEVLKQKSSQEQSAVASPEVKRHLAEFVLQKRRNKDTSTAPGSSTTSMSNLRLVPNAPLAPQPILRKTASESNLLKMKSKRSAVSSAAPYYRTHHPVIPETSIFSGVSFSSSSAASSSKSQNSSPPVGEASFLHDLAQRTSSSASSSPGHGSAPSSPKTLAQHLKFQASGAARGHIQLPKHQRSLEHNSLDSTPSGVNSKSLPNIPSAVARLAGKEGMSKRKSPPPHVSGASASSSGGAGGIRPPPPHHGAMIVRRSKSSAILPLRKHLMEKTMQERKSSVDEEQFYYQQKQQIARERLMIRPIEEVMEEDTSKAGESMDVDETPDRPQLPSFTARLGPLGLSPLVLGEVGPNAISNDYVNRLLPRQPLNLAAGTSDQTGLGYDPLMLKHHCLCENSNNHPENPNRILAIWNRLFSTGLAEQCIRVARRATLEEIQTCHTESHTLVYGTDMINRCSLTGSQELNRESKLGKFCRLDCGGVGVDADTYWNELETPLAVRTAVGTLIELCQKVARNELRNGFAIIRPPGHHAENEEAMGFCYFNAVAIAAKQLKSLPNVRKILIVDWAIHHGNGTQKVFYDDPSVLYLSLHRHDNGNFYPGTGGPVECGSGAGLGFNINVAWAGGLDPPMGDAEYLAAFRSVVLPVARAYDPDIVLVSAGFDAAAGHPHPIGGYVVSTACFAYMTLQLRQLAAGKVVLALEGGFNLDVLAEASEQCVRALMGMPIEKISESELARRPCPSATETLQKTLAIHTPYWEVLRTNADSALLSHLEAWEKTREETEALNAMACLSVAQRQSEEEA